MNRCVGLLIVALAGAGCSSQKSGSTTPAEEAVDTASGPVAGQNYPQEELVRKPDSIKVSGTLQVPGYESGKLQIDVYLPTRQIEGQSPLTTARFDKPGPFELMLPAGTRKAQFMAILDFQDDGPDATDATATYAQNPVDITVQQTGIEITLDKKNTKLPPPKGSITGGDNRPPWEGLEAGGGTGTGAKAAGAAGDTKAVMGAGAAKAGPESGAPPQGKPVPAPPGAKDGPAEGVMPSQ